MIEQLAHSPEHGLPLLALLLLASVSGNYYLLDFGLEAQLA